MTTKTCGLFTVLPLLYGCCLNLPPRPGGIPRHPNACLCPERIVSFAVTHTTASRSFGQTGTDDDFLLIVRLPGDDCELEFPDIPGDERESSKQDVYELGVAGICVLTANALKPEEVFIRTEGSDPWLPSEIKVVAHLENGEARTVVDRKDWPATRWFTTKPDEFHLPTKGAREWPITEKP